MSPDADMGTEVAPSKSNDFVMGTGIPGSGLCRPRGPLPRRSRSRTGLPFGEVLGGFVAVVETEETESLLFRDLKAFAKN